MMVYYYLLQQPDIPDSCESDLAQLMKTCWDMNPKVIVNVNIIQPAGTSCGFGALGLASLRLPSTLVVTSAWLRL